jgi:hypothetical protein
MRVKNIQAFLVFGLAVVSAGCAQKSSPTPPPTPAPKVLIEYHRSGGFAGVIEDLIIYDDGRAVLTQRTGRSEFTLDEDSVKQITEKLEQATFSALKKEYLPERPGADFFEYEISYKGHTVKAQDTAVPESLLPVLESLNEIINSQKK